MKLVDPLATGVGGAENGWAELYIRGTSTRAAWYPDFEATSTNSSGANITLDTYGRAIVYVNRLVTVVVRSAAGIELATFVAGETASVVEYQGAGFRGTNYTSAAVGAGSGYATTVQAILDLAGTAFGSTDWRVPINGVATDVGTAIRGVSGMFVFAKDPTYGAVGDGVTDDTIALQAALTAAGAANAPGLVILGCNEYRITSQLSVPAGVSIWGVHYTKTVIKMAHASNGVITFAGASKAHPPNEVRGIHFAGSQANSGAVITLAANSAVQFSRCDFGNGLNSGTIMSLNTESTVRLDDCAFDCAAGSVNSLVSGGNVHANRCRFTTTAATYTPTNGFIYAVTVNLTDCIFSCSATAGTQEYVKWTSTTVIGNIRGCEFVNGGGGTVTAMVLGTYAAASRFTEVGNRFGSTVTAYSYTSAFAAAGAQVNLISRETRHLSVTYSASPFVIPLDQYGSIGISSTLAGGAVLSHTDPPVGARGSVYITNDDGSSRSFAGASAFVDTTATSIAAGAGNGFLYQVSIGNGLIQILNNWLF